MVYAILKLPAQSRDSENAQRNLEITQIPRLRRTYTCMYTCTCNIHTHTQDKNIFSMLMWSDVCIALMSSHPHTHTGTDTGDSSPDLQIFTYPYVYILIAGIVSVLVMVALTIVIFKKIADRCRGIEHDKSRMFINIESLTDAQRRLKTSN